MLRRRSRTGVKHLSNTYTLQTGLPPMQPALGIKTWSAPMESGISHTHIRSVPYFFKLFSIWTPRGWPESCSCKSIPSSLLPEGIQIKPSPYRGNSTLAFNLTKLVNFSWENGSRLSRTNKDFLFQFIPNDGIMRTWDPISIFPPDSGQPNRANSV